MYYIRHGQSLRNEMKERQSQSKSIEEYNKGKMVQSNFDCGLSETGVQQCLSISHHMVQYNFEVVLVSPLKRALQTCNLILKQYPSNSHPQVIVEPLLTEIINSASNLGTYLQDSIKQFSHFDFSRVKQSVHDWYIYLLRKQKKQHLIKQIKQNQIKCGKKVGKLALKHLNQHKQNLESHDDVSERGERLQQKLRQYRDLFKGNILIVGHSRITKHLCDIDGDTLIPNGKLMYYDIAERKIHPV